MMTFAATAFVSSRCKLAEGGFAYSCHYLLNAYHSSEHSSSGTQVGYPYGEF